MSIGPFAIKEMLAEDILDIGLLLHHSWPEVLITDECNDVCVLSDVVENVMLVLGKVCCPRAG